MKKALSLTLTLLLIITSVLSLASCSKDTSKVRIGVLNGTTGVGIAKLYSDIQSIPDTQYEISVYADQTTMQADLSAGKLDIAAMATPDAAKYKNSEAQKATPIKMLAVNTLGVLYVVTTNPDINTLDDLKGKSITMPTPEGQSPDLIFRALLKKKGLDSEISVANALNPQALLQSVIAGKVEVAVMPEPLVTNATAKLAEKGKTLRNIVSVTEQWGDEEPIAQGCLVVTESFAKEHRSLLKDFLEDYEASVEYMTNPENLDGAAKAVAAMTDLGMSEAVAKKALPNCNLVCITGKEMKNVLTPFYQALYDINNSALGGDIPHNDFYYTK